MAHSKPTLFAPVAPRARENKSKKRADNWQALFLPVDDIPPASPATDPVLSLYPVLYPTADRRPRSVKRRSLRPHDLRRQEGPTNPIHTLREYLLNHFFQKPVSVYTEAGRIQGRVVEVTSDHVVLDTNEGRRAIELHAVFSVAHQVSSR